MDAVIETRGLKKAFHQRPILDNLDMVVGEGDIYGFLGPNGSGKTTTLRILLGLVAADAGQARILGQEVGGGSWKLKQRLNVLPESPGFYGWMRAEEYLAFFAGLYGREIDRAGCGRLLDLVGLAGQGGRLISGFSRGMKQRLGIARTLINEPEVLFLDEPTNGLDPKGRRDIHALLTRLNRQRRLTIILSTHILDDVEQLCNRIGILFQGRLRYQGEVHAFAGGARNGRYRFRFSGNISPQEVERIEGLRVLDRDGSWMYCELAGLEPAQAVRLLVAQGLPLVEAVADGGGLEDLYLKYTTGGAA